MTFCFYLKFLAWNEELIKAPSKTVKQPPHGKNVPFVTTSASANLSTTEYIIYLTFDVKIRIE